MSFYYSVTVKDAIYRAANFIESNQNQYDFFNTIKPNDCGSPGCVLGWIGYFYGTEEKVAGEIAKEMFPNFNHPVPEMLFYDELSKIRRSLGLDQAWQKDANIAAQCLREYANRYL